LYEPIPTGVQEKLQVLFTDCYFDYQFVNIDQFSKNMDVLSCIRILSKKSISSEEAMDSCKLRQTNLGNPFEDKQSALRFQRDRYGVPRFSRFQRDRYGVPRFGIEIMPLADLVDLLAEGGLWQDRSR
jgi:hypothetical protein